jgi:hypothetical protein
MLFISRALIVHVSLFGQDPDSDADLEADFPSLEVGRQRESEKLIGQVVCVLSVFLYEVTG